MDDIDSSTRGVCAILSRDLVAHEMSLSFTYGQVSRKNVRHIKLEDLRPGVLLLFSVKSIDQKEAFINFSLIFFLKVAKQTEGKRRKRNLHPRAKVDQAVRPLALETLSILVGLTLKLIFLCNHN